MTVNGSVNQTCVIRVPVIRTLEHLYQQKSSNRHANLGVHLFTAADIGKYSSSRPQEIKMIHSGSKWL